MNTAEESKNKYLQIANDAPKSVLIGFLSYALDNNNKPLFWRDFLIYWYYYGEIAPVHAADVKTRIIFYLNNPNAPYTGDLLWNED